MPVYSAEAPQDAVYAVVILSVEGARERGRRASGASRYSNDILICAPATLQAIWRASFPRMIAIVSSLANFIPLLSAPRQLGDVCLLRQKVPVNAFIWTRCWVGDHVSLHFGWLKGFNMTPHCHAKGKSWWWLLGRFICCIVKYSSCGHVELVP